MSSESQSIGSKVNRAIIIIIMKKYVLILVAVIIGYICWNFYSNIARTYYEGYVQIEPVTINEIIERLEKVGCGDIDKGVGENCTYIIGNKKYKKNWFFMKGSELNISVYRNGAQRWGGDGLDIIGDRLYVSMDVDGRNSQKTFESTVREDIKLTGNVITPIDGTWTITKTEDITGVSY